MSEKTLNLPDQTVHEMDWFMTFHIQDVILQFQKSNNDVEKFKLMKKINELSACFLEYYEHYEEA